MADIFISYSSHERKSAIALRNRLQVKGYSCWMDESNIKAAAQWSTEIVKAIENCRVFIILLSPASLASHNVVKELTLASESRKKIIPVILQPVIFSHEVKYQLAGLHHVEYNAFDRIESALSEFLQGTQPTTSIEPYRHRHLLAIMFTDIEGYSKIMNTDEARAMEILHFHNSLLQKTIEGNEGRIVEIIGDAFLGVFESAVHAVEAGIEIQRALHAHNLESKINEQFRVRIGIHLGDIIEEDNGIKGDAVNIAARIQSLAPGGGVAISETIYDAVRHKMPLEVIPLGIRKLKNIQDNYRIYVVNHPDIITNPITSNNDQLKEENTSNTVSRRLAVIPFEDLSPNHDNEWFGDGLTGELISTLNKLDKVFVLDPQTSKKYKGSKMTAKQIADELQIRYIITGAVRKAEKNIRVQATLIDTEIGAILWDEKFSGTMEDIFDIQEKTAKDIAEGLKLKLTPEEKKLVEKKLTDNSEAYELYLLAGAHFNRNTKQDDLHAMKLYESAIELDPAFAAAYARTSRLYSKLYRLYGQETKRLELAELNAKKALELEPLLSEGYRALSDFFLQKGSINEAINYAKKTIELDAKSPVGYFQLGFIYSLTGQQVEAAECFEEVLKLYMGDLATHYNLCLAYDRIGNKENLRLAAIRALPYYEQYIRKHPDDQGNRMDYAYLLDYSGKKDESFQQINTIISLPNADGNTLYNAACVLIRQQRKDQGLLTLKRAVTSGFSNSNDFRTDPDLEPVRDMPEFQEILEKLESANPKVTRLS